MVSCTQIENSLQAYIDGELGASDRVLLEQHVGECELCKESLRAQQRTNAVLFTAFSEDRLANSLRYRVMVHLPEMEKVRENPAVLASLINERAKHPVTWWSSLGRLMPAAAVAILLFVTLVLRYSLPETKQVGPVSTIGMVTYTSGGTLHAAKGAPDGLPATLENYVVRGDTLETKAGSGLMFSLIGPTQVKLGDSTKVRVDDARTLTLEQGQIWLDVGRDGRIFKINTPRGEVQVFGTVFSVVYSNNETTVTVERGEVQVTQDNDFRTVEGGQQVVAKNSGELTLPALVNTRQENAWARRITSDGKAESLFNKQIQSLSPTGELPSRPVYIVSTYDGTVTAIRLYWQPDQYMTGHCSYDLYVSGDNNQSILHRRIEGNQFADPGVSTLEIVPDTPIDGMKSLEIRLVPDYSTGRIEIDDIEVKAMVQGS